MTSTDQLLDLERIGQEVKYYQSYPNHEIKKKILHSLSVYIRDFPRLAFRVRDEDLRSDFYLYIYERFDQLLKKYRDDQGKFSTYLSLRLKTYYINFFHQKKSQEKIKITTLKEDLEDQAYIALRTDDSLSVNDSHLMKSDDHDHNPFKYPDYEKDPINYLSLKLYDLDSFDQNDLIKLQSTTQKPYGLLLKCYEMIRSTVAEKKRQRLKYEEKLQKNYQAILQFHQTDREKKNLPRKKSVYLQREKILEKYYRTKVTPPIKLIAKILDQPSSKIANIISYQKSLIYKP